MNLIHHKDKDGEWELGWRSGENARLSSMCPGFGSRTRRHMWVEFVVGSRPSSEGFSPGSPVFLPPQKSTFLNSNSIGNSRATGLSVEDCYVLPSLNKVNLFIYFNGTIAYNALRTKALKERIKTHRKIVSHSNSREHCC